MRKTKRTESQIIDTVVSRLTKGDAFRLSAAEYRAEQARVRSEVTQDFKLGREQFWCKYGQYLYGVKQ